MKKALLPFILLTGIAGIIAFSPNHVSADRGESTPQSSVASVSSTATSTARLQTVSTQTSSAQIPVAGSISVPEAGRLFLMGFGLLISAIYLRKKLVRLEK
jgi:hypothetical protein